MALRASVTLMVSISMPLRLPVAMKAPVKALLQRLPGQHRTGGICAVVGTKHHVLHAIAANVAAMGCGWVLWLEQAQSQFAVCRFRASSLQRKIVPRGFVKRELLIMHVSHAASCFQQSTSGTKNATDTTVTHGKAQRKCTSFALLSPPRRIYLP